MKQEKTRRHRKSETREMVPKHQGFYHELQQQGATEQRQMTDSERKRNEETTKPHSAIARREKHRKNAGLLEATPWVTREKGRQQERKRQAQRRECHFQSLNEFDMFLFLVENYLLRVIPTVTLFCHSFWHLIWKYIYIYSIYIWHIYLTWHSIWHSINVSKPDYIHFNM